MRLRIRKGLSVQLGPEFYRVEAFLPGHVLSRKDEGRLLDLYDLVHFAKATRDRAVSVEQLSRIHPIKPTSDERKGAFYNYHNLIERLLRFAEGIGVELSTIVQSRGDSRALSTAVRGRLRTIRRNSPEICQTRIKVHNPWHAEARVNMLLDALASGADEDDETDAGEEVPHAQHADEVEHAHEA